MYVSVCVCVCLSVYGYVHVNAGVPNRDTGSSGAVVKDGCDPPGKVAEN